MVFCSKCGKSVDDSSKFCPNCGSEVKVSSPESTNTSKQSATQTTIVHTKGGGFFSGLFEGLGGSVGCCCGVVIVIIIIIVLLLLLLSGNR